MSKFFYAKLALNNIRKNSQTYAPYIMTCIATVMMYYINYSLAAHTGLSRISGGFTLKTILSFGVAIVGLFSLIFLFYTNSFLIKRRKKEIGLLNILGMEKKHIGRVMIIETCYVALISLSSGLLFGMLLSKLMSLLLMKILRFKVELGFEISFPAIRSTLMVFSGIFVLTLLSNLRQIHLAKPVELLRGGQVGEKEPNTKWLLILVGLITLGSGYYIALTTESPLGALSMFFTAVILVMIGTYCLFTAGSIGILKLLRKNKMIYYRPQNFTTISGMIYRMKQNAVGLANICILSTMVLVTLSTTVSLYIGVEDVLKTRYPRDIMIMASDDLNIQDISWEILEKHGKEPENLVDYFYYSLPIQQKGNHFIVNSGLANSAVRYRDLKALHFISVADYQRITGRDVDLAPNAILLYDVHRDYPYDTINILGREFIIKERLDSLETDGQDAMLVINSYYVVLSDLAFLEHVIEADASTSYYLGFNLIAEDSEIIRIQQEIRTALRELDSRITVDGLQASRNDFYSIYGGLFFLGIFLGILFILGTMLIIYYKQITEGFDDRQRFEIMQKVGMSKAEVKQSIGRQVLSVFFLPLIVATIHIAFAFKFIWRLLMLFNITKISLFVWCTMGTLLVFALFYSIFYLMTSRMYYKIVT